MVKTSLDNLVGKNKELPSLRRLLDDTKKQIDSATEIGNQSLLELQFEYDKLAAKYRDLLRDVERLERKRDELKNKTEAAGTLYEKYLKQIRDGLGDNVV